DKALQDQNNLLSRKIKEKAKELAETTPYQPQNHNTTNTFSLDLEQPLNSLNTSETYEKEGEVGGNRRRNQSSNNPVITAPWMLQYMHGQHGAEM
ncbi:hypothetical protein C2S51_035617, partial [Perilla frutescens var. frutescens]